MQPRSGTSNPDASVEYRGASCPGFPDLARAAVCAVMTATALAAEPAAGQTRTVWGGVYTEAQAERAGSTTGPSAATATATT